MPWHLDTDLPSGNACCVAHTTWEGRPAIAFQPDPKDSPESLWFRLRLRCDDGHDPAPILIWRNVDTTLGGGDGSRLRPVVQRVDGSWQRLAWGTPIHHSDGRRDAWWSLPEGGVFDLAFCYPYGAEQLDHLLAETTDRLHVRTIGASERGRPLLRIDNGPGAEGSERPGIFLITRQHSGETPGSWVLDGILRRVAELGGSAPLVWAIPFGDVDGVEEGRYGKDRHPIDINRSWGTPSRRHETLCFQRDIARWQKRCRPRLLLDLHAPGAAETTGAYAFTVLGSPGSEVKPTIATWAERFRIDLGQDAAEDFARIGTYPTRWPRETHRSCSAWAVNELGLDALSFEFSYQGIGDRAFTLEDYRSIGRRIADCFAR